MGSTSTFGGGLMTIVGEAMEIKCECFYHRSSIIHSLRVIGLISVDIRANYFTYRIQFHLMNLCNQSAHHNGMILVHIGHRTDTAIHLLRRDLLLWVHTIQPLRNRIKA